MKFDLGKHSASCSNLRIEVLIFTNYETVWTRSYLEHRTKIRKQLKLKLYQKFVPVVGSKAVCRFWICFWWWFVYDAFVRSYFYSTVKTK